MDNDYFQMFSIWWHDLGPETKGAVIQALSTLLAAAVGIVAVVSQIRSQGRQQRTAILESESRKFKAEMYSETVKICQSLDDASVNLSGRLRRLIFDIKVAADLHASQQGVHIPAARLPDLQTSYQAFSDEAIRFIVMIENRRIVDPRIDIFRTAMSVILHDSRVLLFEEFPEFIMQKIPVDNPQGGIFPFAPPSMSDAAVVSEWAERLIKTADDATSYTADFLVEMQNLLLGDLFDKSVHHREPIDPNCIVIKLENAERLNKHFETRTGWGKMKTEVEARVADQLSPKIQTTRTPSP
jgi:hypothetical protein